MNKEEKKVVQEDEIDLVELVKVIWSRRKFILKITGIFVVLGLVIAFTSKVEYEASCKLLPEVQSSSAPNLGGLSGLAGLAGFDLSNLGDGSTISPILYPEIAKSAPFINNLMNTPVYFEKYDTTISSYQYFKEVDSPSLIGYFLSYTLGLPGKIKELFRSSEVRTARKYDMIRFSQEDWQLLESFSNRLAVSINEDNGTISIIAEMPDAVASAQVAKHLVDNLTEMITDYKLEKARLNLEFITEQFSEAQAEYRRLQNKVAHFNDKNRNVNSSLAQVEFSRLENEANIAFEVYKGLATQLEQSKIKVKEETPIFTILEPVKIPEDKSKPKRAIILFVFVLIGSFFSIIKVIWNKIF